MSSNSSLERSIEETRADAMDSTTTSAESASAVINRSQDNQFHEAYFVSRLVVLFQNGASSFKIDFDIFFVQYKSIQQPESGEYGDDQRRCNGRWAFVR